jgi:hypothetical protein
MAMGALWRLLEDSSASHDQHTVIETATNETRPYRLHRPDPE